MIKLRMRGIGHALHPLAVGLCCVSWAARILAAQERTHPAGTEALGTVRFPTSCAAAVATPFNRAVALLHSFEFSSAIVAFNTVLATDSSCAMAHWGIALSRWGNPFAAGIRGAAQLRPGRDAIERAQRTQAPTDRERGYIAAVAQLFENFERTDQHTRVVAYEQAMHTLVQAQPADTEAVIFYALALAASAAPGDKSYANQRRAVSILEGILAKQPNHPGVAHYLIHSHDVPALADGGLDAARRYGAIAPSAPHALHMPSHIYTRVGAWQESIETNLKSIEASLRDGSLGEALHASDYMMYAYLQTGQDQAAKRVLSGLPALAAKFDPTAIGGAAPGSAGVFAIAAIPARWVLERRAWAEAAALEPKSTAFAWTEGLTHTARALGAVHTGDLARARASIDSLASIHTRLVQAGEAYWAGQVEIARLGANAWLLLAQHQEQEALKAMQLASTREDLTEKSAVTPGPLVPARELLGDMLLELKRPAEALIAYRATLEKEPNRFNALYGAARAARLAGDSAAAALYVAQLRNSCKLGDVPGRPELADIRRLN